MCKAYLVDCPSTSFTLRNLGAKTRGWLRAHPKWAGRTSDVTPPQMGRHRSVNGKARESRVAYRRTCGAAGGDLRLQLQPYVRLLDLHYPVDDLLLAMRKDDEDTDFASNAFQERRKRKHIRAVAKLKQGVVFLVVHRIDNSVYFRRIRAKGVRGPEFSPSKERPCRKSVDPAFRGSKISPRRTPRDGSAMVSELGHAGMVLPSSMKKSRAPEIAPQAGLVD